MSLGFLQPLLLAGLALVAVPFLIHFISRRKARFIHFAALEFIMRSTKRRTRRMRLRQLFLLLVRTLIVAALAAAIAGPQLIAHDIPEKETGLTQLAICLDASASMQTKSGTSTLFELAKEQLLSRIKRLEPTIPVALYLVRNEVTPLVEPASFDHAQVVRLLNQAEVTNETSDMGLCLARAKGAQRPGDKRGNITVVVVTDGAAHAWQSTAMEDGQLAVELVRVPSPESPEFDNGSVVDLTAQPSALAPADTYDVLFQMRRANGLLQKSPREVEVTLAVEERPVSRVTATLPPNGLANKRFMQVPIGLHPGSHTTLTVSTPPDSYSLDDQAILPLELPRDVRVTIINGDPQTVGYRDEVFYLEKAVIGDLADSARFAARIVNVDNANLNDINSADVVVLANVNNLVSELARSLVKRVQEGGGLLITSGEQMDTDFYNGALADILPAQLRGAKSSVPLHDPTARELLTMEVVDEKHAIFQALGGRQGLGLARARTHTVMLVDPGSQSERMDLLRFNNGAPALVERQVRLGRALLLCTSVDRDWSDLAIRPGFLPLVQQTLLYLADAIEVPRQRRFTVLSQVELRPPREATKLEITSPSGDTTTLAIEQGLAARFLNTTQVGLYQVTADMGAGGRRDLPKERFSIHVDEKESETALLDLQSLQSRLPEGVRVARQSSAPIRERPLWPYLLAALAFLLVAEALASRRG